MVTSPFKPYRFGKAILANRFAMAPMTRRFAPGGVPGPDVADYYRKRAAGEVGLIITEGAFIPAPGAGVHESTPRFHGEDALEGWRQVANAVHAEGGVIVPQLWHVGLAWEHAVPLPASEQLKRGPSGLLHTGERMSDPLSESEIADIIAAYAQAAASAVRAGFDGIELHGAHGYLLDQFLWSATNRREDGWGGDLERRSRLAAEVVSACRAATAPDFPIIFRMSQWKQQDYAARLANTPDALERMLRPIVDAGADFIHCSQRRYWDPEFAGSDMNLAGWVKKLLDIPTITVGSIGLDGDFISTRHGTVNPAGVDTLLAMFERGDFDLMAVGRALISDPDWVAKLHAGRLADAVPFDASFRNRL